MYRRTLAFTLRLVLLIALGLGACGMSARQGPPPGEVPAASFDSALPGYFGGWYTLGYTFTTAQDVTVSALGYYDDGLDGLTTAHDIGIFDANGKLVAAATVRQGSVDQVVGKYRYRSIDPVVLPKGQSYTIGGTSNLGIDSWVYGDMGSSLTGFSVNSSIVVEPDSARFTAGIPLAWPVHPDGDLHFLATANFLIKDPVAPPAPNGSPSLSFDSALPGYFGGWYTLGYTFTTTQDVTVSALGYYDDSGDGLAMTHDVGIFDSDGNLVVSTALNPGDADELIGKYRYHAINPVVLPRGRSYTIGATSNNGVDPWAYGKMGSSLKGLSVNSSIVVEPDSARFTAGIPLAWPVHPDGDLHFLATANFLIKDPVAPPAPNGSPSLSFDSALPGYFGGWYTLGYTFTTTQDVTVSALGYYDDGGDGFDIAHDIGIFDAQGNLVASTSLSPGSSDKLIDKYRYRSINPVVLPKGHSYTIGGTSNNGVDPWAYGKMGSSLKGLSVNSSIVVEPDSARFTAGIPLAWPVHPDGDLHFLATANFLIKDPVPPPVPTGSPSLSFSSARTDGFGGWYTLGYAFSTNSDTVISALGYYDDSGDDFAAAHDVGIFDAGGKMLATTTVGPGTADILIGKYRYRSIPPIVLPKGGSYTIGGTSNLGVDAWAFGNAGSTLTDFSVDPSISIMPNASRFKQGDKLAWPQGVDPYTVYAGPNFLVGRLAPEPDTFIVSGPDAGATSCASSVTFSFSGADDVTPTSALVYRHRIDGGAWSAPAPDTTVTLNGLTDGSHTFDVAAIDTDNNVDKTPASRQFFVDTTPPVISNLAAGAIRVTSAGISWTTDERATSAVDYRLHGVADWTTLAPDASLATAHAISISGLAPGTSYEYRARSSDACGRESVSAVLTFTTLGAPDLQVTAIQPLPDLWTDSAFDFSWTDSNLGTAPAVGPWVDRVYLSRDDQLSGDDVLIGEYPIALSLPAKHDANRTETLSIPRAAVPKDGTYYLIVYTDVNNTVNEGPFEGNNTRAQAVTVRRTPLPDLVVTDIQGPNEAFAGQTIEVKFTVKNQGGGSTDASLWNDWVYLSTDNVPEIEDPFHVPVPNVTYLDAGESYVSTVDIPIPRNIAGDYNVLVYTDFNGSNHPGGVFNVVEEDETNNWNFVHPIHIKIPPLPDLQVPSVQAPGQAFAGQPMLVSWRVENHGTGPTPPTETTWNDSVYLAHDKVLDPSRDRLLGTFQHAGALAVGNGYDVRDFSVNVPNNVAGDWYVLVYTDSGNQVFEFANEGNNTGTAPAKVHVIASPPDLTARITNSPPGATAGDTIQVQWQVTNQGAFPANGGWFDSLYLGNGAAPDPKNDVLLGTFPSLHTLDAGASYTQTQSAVLPDCLSGSYFLYVFTDSRNEVFEYSPDYDAEANNLSPPAPLQLSLAAPNLVVTAVKAPASGKAGETIAVQWTVANQGAGPTRQTSWVDRVYFNLTAKFDPATALAAASVSRSGALAPGASYNGAANVVVPANTQGPYFVFVWTDANNVVPECGKDDDNWRGAATSTQVNNQLPDLTIQSIQPPPPSVLSGDTMTLQWTGKNNGEAATHGSWVDRVYLSADANLDDNDLPLGQAIIVGPVAAGKTYVAQATFTLPPVPAATYTLIVKADADNFVFEGQHEDNNTDSAPLAISTPDVDLQVTAVGTPAEATSGQTMAVTWSVANKGKMPTLAKQWTDRVILSKDQILDPSDAVIGFGVHKGALAAGDSYMVHQDVVVPPGLSGPYYVFVRTDWFNQVAETDEFNNVGGPAAVNLTLPPPVDLVVTHVEPLPAASPGDTVTFQWTVLNQRTNTATGNWTDTVYVSTSPVWDISAALVGRATRAGPLPGGQSYTGTLTAEIPDVDPGSYYVIVRADSRNQVREDDETNNTGVSTTATAIDAGVLPLGQSQQFNLIETGKKKHFKTPANGNETFLYTLTGQNPLAANELYARFGHMASLSAYDFLFDAPGQPDQQIVVPNTTAGWYYSMARAGWVPSGAPGGVNPGDPVTLKVESIPFSIRSVSPTHIGDNGQVTITIHGARFSNDCTVKLVSGSTTLTPAKVWAVDGATLKARFLLSSAPHGSYSAALRSPSGADASLADAIAIEQASGFLANVDLVTNTAPIAGRTDLSFVQVHNTGNVDLPYVDIRVFGSSHMQMEVVAQSGTLLAPDAANPDTDSVFGTDVSGTTRAALFIRDIAPETAVPLEIRLDALPPERFKLRVDVAPASVSDAVARVRAIVEDNRQVILNEALPVSPDLEATIKSPDAFWSIVATGLVASRRFDADDFQRGPGARAADGNPSNLGDPCKCNDPHIYTKLCATKGVLLYGPCVMNENTKCILSAFGGATGRDSCDCLINPDQPHCKQRRNSSDPNDKQGPSGFGPQAFTGIQHPWPYTIEFENVSSATAAARQIKVTDKLDPGLDPRSFRLKEIGFGKYRIPVPENRAFFQARIPLGDDLGNLVADITAGLDIGTGQVFWTLTAIDPKTGEQPNSALLGLLPPNDDTARGQGYVTYTISLRAGTPTGTAISNGATITFDSNQPIDTNTVTNTVDAVAPSSNVLALPASSPANFTVRWSGSDDAGGSDIQSFDIWVSDNNGPFQPWITGSTDTSALFQGALNHTYRFYSIARDNAGNVEDAPAVPDATTTVGGNPNAVPVLTRLTPNQVAAGGAGLTLRVDGRGFLKSSVVRWDGSDRQTKYVSAARLQATIPASDLAQAGTASVTVFNPLPGGGESNALPFAIGEPRLIYKTVVKRTKAAFVATVTIGNGGTAAALAARLLSATLGAAATTTPLPLTLEDLPPRRVVTAQLSFPLTAGKKGQTVPLAFSGDYTGGSIANTVSVKLP